MHVLDEHGGRASGARLERGGWGQMGWLGVREGAMRNLHGGTAFLNGSTRAVVAWALSKWRLPTRNDDCFVALFFFHWVCPLP